MAETGDSDLGAWEEAQPVKAVRPILSLSASLLLLWTLWAVLLRPLVPTQSADGEVVMGILARCVFWLVPSGLYLWTLWGVRWREPIGFGFPLGWRQAVRTVLVATVVAGFFLVGTAAQMGLAPGDLFLRLVSSARFHLTAPFFEEVVFRGIVLSELLNWVHSHRKSDIGLVRVRFWGSQIVAASVFTLIHWPWWMVHQGFSQTLTMSAPVFSLGFILGFVFANTRSIWACIFLHWLNNQLSVLG